MRAAAAAAAPRPPQQAAVWRCAPDAAPLLQHQLWHAQVHAGLAQQRHRQQEQQRRTGFSSGRQQQRCQAAAAASGYAQQQERGGLQHTSTQHHDHQQHHHQQQDRSAPLSELLQRHIAHHSQQQQQQPGPGETLRLQRKLTLVLRDSASSATDVADTLLAAERAGCLNALHLAAALATLARLQQARAAAAGGGYEEEGDDDGDDDGSSGGLTSTVAVVVPLTKQQARQMRTVSAAAAAPGAGSRWHAWGLLQAAGTTQQQQQQHMQEDEEEDEEEEQAAQFEAHLVDQLMLAMLELWGTLTAANITSCCWALAVLQAAPPAPLLHQAGSALRGMAASLAHHSSAAGEAVSDSWDGGAAPPSLLQACPRQVVVVMWALAKLASDVQDVLPAQQQQQQHQHEERAAASSSSSSGSLVLEVLGALAPHMRELTDQGLLMLLWAAATWTPMADAPDGATSSSGSSSSIPPSVAAPLLAACEARIHSQMLAPRGLTVVLWAAARLSLCPPPAWLAAWLAAVHTALPGCDAHDAAMCVWALARLGCPPPSEWLADVSRRAGQLAGSMGQQELPALLWALAVLRFRPDARVATALLQRGAALAARGALPPQGLALLLWAPARLEMQMPGRWVDGVLAAAAGFLPLSRPEEASCLLVSLARLKHIPPTAWMDVWWRGSAPLLAAARGRQLVLLLWAAVRLGQAPPRAWLRAWLGACADALARGEVGGQGLGLMWDALAQLAGAGAAASTLLEGPDGQRWWAAHWAATQQPATLASMSALTAERTLAGLAAVSACMQDSGAPAASHAGQQGGDGLRLPRDWLRGFLPASQATLPGANLYNIGNTLQAAAELELQLPPLWLAVAMARLRRLLELAGVLPQGLQQQHGAGGRSARSLALSARLQRRWLEMCLRRVLFGLRAQQLLTPLAQRRLWARAATLVAGDTAAAGAGGAEPDGGDVLSVWPWLADAVTNSWPDTASAREALQVLGGAPGSSTRSTRSISLTR